MNEVRRQPRSSAEATPPQQHARPTHPLVIIGLDGATFDILDPLCAQGRLPNIARLLDQGLRTELRSTYPPATLPASVANPERWCPHRQLPVSEPLTNSQP